MEPLDVARLVAGPALLVVGAELLVRGSARLAAAVGLSPLVIGLTVVSYGTGAPELAVSLSAAWADRGDIALGNVIGSNILNVLLVLGITAIVAPLVVQRRLVQSEVPFMIGASLLTLAMAADGVLSRIDGAVLVAGVIGFTLVALRLGKRFEAPAEAHVEAPVPIELTMRLIAMVVVGLALLVLGGRWIVDGAVAIARGFGISELVIGLTIVALGTSLPEVATSLIAAVRGQREIAVGNVIGSNIFNLLAVLGTTVVVVPDGIVVARSALVFDLPVMVAAAAVCLPIFFTHGRIDRWEGGLLLATFAAYLAYLALRGMQHPWLPSFAWAMVTFVLPLAGVALATSVLAYQRAAAAR